MTPRRSRLFWAVQISGWLLLVVLACAQITSAFNYDLGIAMGFQKPAEMITEVGRASWHGFAIADSIIYVPVMAIGLFGHARGTSWGRYGLAAAAGISLYWPAVFGATLVLSRSAADWHLDTELPVWAFGAVFFAWALVALWSLARDGR